MNPIFRKTAQAIAPVMGRHQNLVLSLRLRKALGRPRQDPPHSFFDKVFWMSVHADTSLWSQCADKIGVREYVASRCGTDVLPKLYATYSNANDIDFDTLPDRFVIKTNNGCAANHIVRSKMSVESNSLKKELNEWLFFPYGELTGQLHYSMIPPRILAEELMFQEDDPQAALVDYKFYCFDGVPLFCFVNSNRSIDNPHSYARMMYDMEWNVVSDACLDSVDQKSVQRPSTLDRMIKVSRDLSLGFPFVRVDLYEVNGSVKFGEMTFTPGMGSGFTEGFQLRMGDLITLPKAVR